MHDLDDEETLPAIADPMISQDKAINLLLEQIDIQNKSPNLIDEFSSLSFDQPL